MYSSFSGAGSDTVRVERSSGLQKFDTFPGVDLRRPLSVYSRYGLIPRCNSKSTT
jgi:hypothetical protein